MLREVTLVPTTERDERWHSRGVANAPAKGGRAVVHARADKEDRCLDKNGSPAAPRCRPVAFTPRQARYGLGQLADPDERDRWILLRPRRSSTSGQTDS